MDALQVTDPSAIVLKFRNPDGGVNITLAELLRTGVPVDADGADCTFDCAVILG